MSPVVAIQIFSFAGDWLIDPFAGSGTTLDAAACDGRNAIGIEAVSRYVASMTDADID